MKILILAAVLSGAALLVTPQPAVCVWCGAVRDCTRQPCPPGCICAGGPGVSYCTAR